MAVAARLAEGRVTLATFETPFPEQTRNLATRIEWEPLQNAHFPSRFEAELTAELDDGRVLTVRVDDVYGNASRPASEADIRQKFRANAALALDDAAIASLEQSVADLDTAASLAAISAALRVRRPLLHAER